MDTPDREAKSLQHFLRERSDPVTGPQVTIHIYPPNGRDAVAAPAGKNIVDAYNKAADYLRATFPGYTF